MALTMTKLEREAFLAGVHVGIISIAEEGRGPLTVPIWYAYEPGGELRVITGRNSRKGRLLAHVTLRGPKFIPPVTVGINVEEQPRFPDAPVLVLRWSLPKLGFLGNMAAPFVSQLTSLPPGVRIEGERVLVDVAEMLRARGLGETVRYVRRLDVGTRVGQILVRFELRT